MNDVFIKMTTDCLKYLRIQITLRSNNSETLEENWSYYFVVHNN